MKKIDFHIHTIPVPGKDADFQFDLSKFQLFVNELEIDGIAITNHNVFDLSQFEEIENRIKGVTIFPGIEVDFEGGHLLIIGDRSKLAEFDAVCKRIELETEKDEQISVIKLKEILLDLNSYLLIPHFDKKPKVNQSAIDALKDHIFSGEVQSPKKFNRLIKEAGSLTPVLFSDTRISTDLEVPKHQGRQTFIKTKGALTLNVIKACLRDKSKVFLTDSAKHGFFQVFSNGQELSNGLNIVVGSRSSGKTHLLNEIKNVFDTGDKSIKYIRQFDLVRDDEKQFNETVEREKSAVREKYLKPFQTVVEDVMGIDRNATEYKIEKYIDTLLEFAASERVHDEYSRAVLFTETPFHIRPDEELAVLLGAVTTLLKQGAHYKTIARYVSEGELKNLLVELERLFRENTEERLKKEWINQLIRVVSGKLKKRTASPNIEHNDIDFFDIKLESERVKKFNAIANAIKKTVTVGENPSFEKFTIQAVACAYTGASELHDESHKQISFTNAFKKYGVPINFLEELRSMPGLEKTELYRYFCKVNYGVLNKYGKNVSGGERAEFNLLKALQDARQFEMLLVDEPESSFDNLFLKDNVNNELKEIAMELPVVVVTHNNTVGMLMHPDYILFTQRKITQGRDEYHIFSGSPGMKEFKTAGGEKTIDSHDILLDTLEAGKEAYSERQNLYNNFKK